MLRVTVALHPFGAKEASKTWTATIGNTGKGTLTKGEYRIRFNDAAGRLWQEVDLKDFPRKKAGPWQLLYDALDLAFMQAGERGKGK